MPNLHQSELSIDGRTEGKKVPYHVLTPKDGFKCLECGKPILRRCYPSVRADGSIPPSWTWSVPVRCIKCLFFGRRGGLAVPFCQYHESRPEGVRSFHRPCEECKAKWRCPSCGAGPKKMATWKACYACDRKKYRHSYKNTPEYEERRKHVVETCDRLFGEGLHLSFIAVGLDLTYNAVKLLHERYKKGVLHAAPVGPPRPWFREAKRRLLEGEPYIDIATSLRKDVFDVKFIARGLGLLPVVVTAEKKKPTVEKKGPADMDQWSIIPIIPKEEALVRLGEWQEKRREEVASRRRYPTRGRPSTTLPRVGTPERDELERWIVELAYSGFSVSLQDMAKELHVGAQFISEILEVSGVRPILRVSAKARHRFARQRFLALREKAAKENSKISVAPAPTP